MGTQIFQAQATDADRDGLAPVTYRLTNNPPPIEFRINPTTGAVTTLTTFDFETSSSQFTLTIEAVDEGGRTSAPETLTIRLVNANDLNPVFDLAVYVGARCMHMFSSRICGDRAADHNDVPIAQIDRYRTVLDETNQTGITLVTVRAAERVAGRVLRTGLVYNLTNTTAAEGNTFRLTPGTDRDGFPVAHVVSTAPLDFESQAESVLPPALHMEILITFSLQLIQIVPELTLRPFFVLGMCCK